MGVAGEAPLPGCGCEVGLVTLPLPMREETQMAFVGMPRVGAKISRPLSLGTVLTVGHYVCA